jgi:hypothetical protein
MKLETNYGKIEGKGIMETSAFSMRASPVAFEILSKSLYSDPKRAVLREVGCNAYDGHVAAGNPDVPFEVKLPNGIDPQLYIKDFGIGLNHDDVVNLMTTYFSSSKSTSNEFIGCMGLGSKSPFAYTDSFTIVANKDGISRTYVAYKGESGEPQVSLMAESEVSPDWQTGVMVGFPVKPEHHRQFVELASDVFRYFKVPPRILGADIAFERPHYHLTGSNFGIKLGGVSNVTMGNVAYPLKEFDTEDEHVRNFLKQFKIDISLPIGSVAVAASREELHYDKHTLKSLELAIKGVMSELPVVIIQQHEKGGDTVWDKRQAFASCVFKFSGYALDTIARLLTQAKREDLAKMVSERHVPVDPADIKGFSGMAYKPKRTYRGRSNFRIERVGLDEMKGLSFDSTPIFVISDATRAEQRARSLVTEGNVVVFLTKTHRGQDDLEFRQNVEAFLTKLGNPTTVLSSSVELPEREPLTGQAIGAGKSRVNKRPTQLVEVVKFGESIPDTKKDVEVDVEDGVTRLYLYKDKNRIRVSEDEHETFYTYSNVVRFLGTAVGQLFDLPGDGNVYLLTPTQASKVTDKSNWLHLPDVLAARIEDPFYLERFRAARIGVVNFSYYHNFAKFWRDPTVTFSREVIAGTRLAAGLEQFLDEIDGLNKPYYSMVHEFQRNNSYIGNQRRLGEFLGQVTTSNSVIDELVENYPLITAADLNQILFGDNTETQKKHLRTYLLASDAMHAIEVRKGQIALDLGGLNPEVEKQVLKAA